MKSETLDRFRTELLARRAVLKQDLQHIGDELRDLSIEQEDERGSTGNHFADDGSSLGEQERLSTLEGNFREQLQMIDNAIERMDEGTYGLCARCGKQINEERLEALPFAAYCIECQSFLERQAELYGTAIHPT
jgi:RNA polymerase-binding protein DksA